MEFVLVLILILLLIMVSPTAADGNITLEGCPARCGNISIPFPFGIIGLLATDTSPCDGWWGLGMFCNRTTNMLFLAVNDTATTYVVTNISLDPPQVTIDVPFVVIPADIDHLYTNWTDFNGPSYSLSPYTLSTANKFYLVGSNVSAFLSEPDQNAGVEMSVDTKCSSTAYNTSSCGVGCCSTSIPPGMKSYFIDLKREDNSANKAKAFLSSSAYSFTKQDLHSDLINGTAVVPVLLDWTIPDPSSCDGERGYVCISANSHCVSQTVGLLGFHCRCSEGYRGNPYIRNGCQVEFIDHIIHPGPQCQTTCGDFTIPFPFGLEKGCYRDSKFSLSCNKSLNPPLLLLQDTMYQVTEILLQEGKLRVDLNLSRASLQTTGLTGLSKESTVFDWMADTVSCKNATKNISTFACISHNSKCYDQVEGTHQSGYRCKCSIGYQGNPYIFNGCTDIDECKQPEKYLCNGICSNSIGNYSCVCSPGTHGNPTKGSCYPNKNQSFFVLVSIIGASIGMGLLLLSMGAVFLYRRLQERRLNMVKEKHFRKNRGLLLQQLISHEDVAERTKIFSLEELEKATNNFDDTRILGRGGHGTVFKGILLDQRVVAIKKSKIAVQSEIDQFINEVVILSQLNHRNVVKLFGCCLETEVPLLVYEFVSNGTLSDHIHLGERTSSLSWGDRLRIAREAAGALAYLHSSASISIFHRDVKSSNILLDESCTAKVSDFGASRSIPLDQTRVVTVVQGTFGYLDPEYYHTGQLTQKSDVYSFGVILVELLTGEKPICFNRAEDERNLSIHFLSSLRNGRLSQIVETRVMEEATREELDAVAKIAEMCLRLRGERRPTMKEVEASLGGLTRFARQSHEESGSLRIEQFDAQYGPPTFRNSNESESQDLAWCSSLEKRSILSLSLPR